jgi:L-cystine transport system substrate-binding protein
MKKLSLAVIAAFVLSVLLTACSAASFGSTPSGSTPSGSIKKVIVAVASEEKPLSYTDDKGNLVGYEVDALKALDQAIPEYEFDIQSVEADSQQIGLDAGKYALIAEGLFKTKEREEKYLLPEENIGVSLIKIVTRGADTGINTLDDLVGKKVAPVSPNGGIFNLLTAYNNDHDSKITIETQEGQTNAEKYQGIASGKYDATVLPAFGFEELKKSLNLDLRQSPPVKVNATYLVLGKDQTDLASKINEAIKKLKADGTLKDLSVKYFGEDVFQYEATK